MIKKAAQNEQPFLLKKFLSNTAIKEWFKQDVYRILKQLLFRVLNIA